MKSRTPLIIEVTRGPLIESHHEVVCVIADKRGHIVGYAGNLDYPITPRSSIKFLQALPLLESGAFETYKLKDYHLALACASHKAQKHHLEALKEWLGLIGQSDSLLRCGPGEGSTSSLTHNCSGKHLGMITSAMHMKMNPKNYDEFSHPYQEFLRKYLTDVTHIDFTKAPHAIDGCCIPTYGMPIQKLALAMATFVGDDPANPRVRFFRQTIDAIKKYPQYLSGEQDLTHKLIETTHGRAIMKTGAEGSYVGLMPDLGLAFAVKAVDGSSRAAEFACLQLFKHHGAIAAPEAEKLKEFMEPAVLNSRKEKVGSIRIKPAT